MILHNIDISVQVRENWVLFSRGFQRLSEIILRYEGAQGVDQRSHGKNKIVLLVSIIRRLTRKQRGHSLQHLKLNILSFQLLDFIKEIGTIQTLIFKYCSFFQPNVYNSR